MQIGVTNPLREFLRWKPFGKWEQEPDALFCWDAHRVKVGGRIMLVVCNAANRFAGVRAMRAADWKRLGEACPDLIGQAMLNAGFRQSAVDEYLALGGAIEFGRTHGRKPVACMNRMVEALQWCECDRAAQYQPLLMHVVNDKDLCHCATRGDYGYAAQWMAEDLRAHGIEPLGEGPGFITFPSPGTKPQGAAFISDEEAIAELDAIIASLGDEDDSQWAQLPVGPANGEDAERMRKIDEAIAAAELAMLAERGSPAPHEQGCRVCGAEPRVRLDEDSYCLGCYNELMERVAGLPRVTNDRSTLAVFGSNGDIMQFCVERMVMPIGAEWVAHEAVAEDDPRRELGYEGVEVRTFTDPARDQDEALAELWEKAQQAVATPSTSVEENARGITVENGAHIGNEVRFAEDVGWGRIDMVGEDYVIVIDGQRYTGEQFLRLFSAHLGFIVHWHVTGRSAPLPE